MVLELVRSGFFIFGYEKLISYLTVMEYGTLRNGMHLYTQILDAALLLTIQEKTLMQREVL